MNGTELVAHFANVVGKTHVLTDSRDMAAYATDWRKRYLGAPLAVVRPATTAEVAAVVKACAETRTAIVPQGGNTGLCGGATPDGSGNQVIVSLGRMNRIRALDPVNNTMTVEAGCVLANLQQAADEAERLFPLSLAAEGSCEIGGNLSTNAGGVQVLRYGNTRDLVLGLEVVLPDGRDLGRAARPAQGQHRLRPEAAVRRRGGHARHHHRGGAEALSEAAGASDGGSGAGDAPRRVEAARARAGPLRRSDHGVRAVLRDLPRPGAEALPARAGAVRRGLRRSTR